MGGITDIIIKDMIELVKHAGTAWAAYLDLSISGKANKNSVQLRTAAYHHKKYLKYMSILQELVIHNDFSPANVAKTMYKYFKEQIDEAICDYSKSDSVKEFTKLLKE